MMELQFFPSRTLAIYMAKAFLMRTLAVLAPQIANVRNSAQNTADFDASRKVPSAAAKI